MDDLSYIISSYITHKVDKKKYKMHRVIDRIINKIDRLIYLYRLYQYDDVFL